MFLFLLPVALHVYFKVVAVVRAVVAVVAVAVVAVGVNVAVRVVVVVGLMECRLSNATHPAHCHTYLTQWP